MKPFYEREALIWAAKLSANEKFVLLCINSFASAEGECFPGYDRIAERTGLTRRTAIRIVKTLESLGVITRLTRHKPNGVNDSNFYRVLYDNLVSQGDTGSLTRVTQDHPKGDTGSLGGCHRITTRVTQDHQGSDTGSPYEGDTGSPELIQLTDPIEHDQLTTRAQENFESKQPEPDQHLSPVNPVENIETPKAGQRVAEDKYSAARKFSPEEIKNNPTLRSDLAMRTGHRFPELIAAGLEEIWIGPGYTDFAPAVVIAAQRYLKSIERSDSAGSAITYLKNCIVRNDWAALELCLRNSNEISMIKALPEPAVLTLAEMSESEPQASLAELQRVKATRELVNAS